MDKYVTISRDGSFKLWNGNDMKHFRTITPGASWITDCIYMPQVGKPWAAGVCVGGVAQGGPWF